MATATNLLTIEQFHELYDHEHGYEYWFGKAIKKPMPTVLHSILQVLLGEFIDRAGYLSGSEMSLRMSSEWEPRPDVTGILELEEPYPIKPVPLVIEIPLKGQNPSLIEKCRHYTSIGISQILVFDPETRSAFQWNQQVGCLEPFEQITLTNGSMLNAADVWNELDRRYKKLRTQ